MSESKTGRLEFCLTLRHGFSFWKNAVKSTKQLLYRNPHEFSVWKYSGGRGGPGSTLPPFLPLLRKLILEGPILVVKELLEKGQIFKKNILDLFHGSLYNPFWGNQTIQTSMVMLRDFPYNIALFGLVSYNDPCTLGDLISWSWRKRVETERLDLRWMLAPYVFGGQADGFFLGKASGMSSNWMNWAFFEGDSARALMNLKEKMVMLGILPKWLEMCFFDFIVSFFGFLMFVSLTTVWCFMI